MAVPPLPVMRRLVMVPLFSSLALLFVTGFAVGAWLGGRRTRALWKAAGVVPLIILLLGLGLVIYLLWAAGRGDSFAALAAVSVGALAVVAAPVAFIGGLFGVRWRRAGKGEA